METVLRVAVIYLFIMIGLRALGKRDFSQISPFDLVTLLLIPEIVQQAIVREDFSITNALIGLSTLFTLVLLTSAITHKSKRAEDIIEGTPTVIVSNGRFVEDNMNKERITPDEVYAEMRKSGLASIEEVRWAILESDGKISFIPTAPEDRQIKSESEPVV
jgi:uncharacterized membrane protein YcaP (DUF421 family)